MVGKAGITNILSSFYFKFFTAQNYNCHITDINPYNLFKLVYFNKTMMKFISRFQKYKLLKVNVGTGEFISYLSDSLIKRALGLMFLENINNNYAMLFKFPNLAKHAIWMKNMQFSIDAIWLDENLKVIHIEENLPPASSIIPISYKSFYKAKYILEMPSGSVEEKSIKRLSNVTIDETYASYKSCKLGECPVNSQLKF